MRLNRRERKRYDSGLMILKTLSTERSVISKTVKPSDAANVPDNSSDEIRKIIQQVKNHEVYGSLATKSKTMASRDPNDIDVAVDNPYDKALKIAEVLKRKGHNVKISSMEQFNSHVVQIKKKGEWVDVVDLHAHEDHVSRVFDVYGKTTPPDKIDGLYIQTTNDQLLRKGNSVMAYDEKTNVFGARPHRKAKDVGDFITTSRLLLDSKELKARAELARVKAGRERLKVWRKHAKGIKGASKNLGKDPIPDEMEKMFIDFAVKNPEVDVDDIKFKTRRTFRKKKVENDNVLGLFDIELPFIKNDSGGRIKKEKSKREPYNY